MDSDIPLVPLNDGNSAGNGERDIKTAPVSPTLSQKSILIESKEKHTETISIDVSSEVPHVKQTITHEQISIQDLTNINSLLPEYMKNPMDVANGGNENDPNVDPAKKKQGIKDAPDGFNQYRNEKSFSQGLLDIALFTSNVNQLRAVTKNPASNFGFYFIVILLVLSIIFQIGIGLILLLSSRYNVNKEDERKTVYRMGSYVVSGVFLITIFNLIIAVFYNYDNPAGIQMQHLNSTY